MGVLVEAAGMRDPMTSFSAAAKQAAVDTLLSLALSPPAGGTQALAEKAVLLAPVLMAELPS